MTAVSSLVAVIYLALPGVVTAVICRVARYDLSENEHFVKLQPC